MTTGQYVTHDELTEILKPLQDALRGASALDVQYRHLATKGDIEALESRLESKLASKIDVQALRSDVQELKELLLRKL